VNDESPAAAQAKPLLQQPLEAVPLGKSGAGGGRCASLAGAAMAQRKPLLEAFKFSVYIAREWPPRCGLSGAHGPRRGSARPA
jgi:hypothetical protein